MTTVCELPTLIAVSILVQLVEKNCLGREGKELGAQGSDSSLEAGDFDVVIIIGLGVFEAQTHDICTYW